VDNLQHWTGEMPSARNVEYYYNESELTAIRIGPWKSHMLAREGFFDHNEPSALVFNLRQDPFEQRDDFRARELAMRLGIAWGGQIQDALRAHHESLVQFPPRQRGGTLRPGSK
jgi:arylsulfatase